MAALSLRQVSRIHAGARRTVNRVSAEIADGEFVVIVGPSGCGKSTLLRMTRASTRWPRARSPSTAGG